MGKNKDSEEDFKLIVKTICKIILQLNLKVDGKIKSSTSLKVQIYILTLMSNRILNVCMAMFFSPQYLELYRLKWKLWLATKYYNILFCCFKNGTVVVSCGNQRKINTFIAKN